MTTVFLVSLVKNLLNRWVLATLFMTIVFLLINHSLLTGNAAGIWDIDGAYMPYQVLVADYARAGKFLLWDILSNGGIPSSGDPQIGAFSPLNVLIGFITGGSTIGFIIYWLFVWWLGGCGVIILGWYFKVPVWGALIVALEYLFIGIYITNAEHTALTVGFSFIPFIIWRIDVAICSNRIFPAIQAGALWGLSALGGYPSCAILTALYCGLWILGRLLFNKQNTNEERSGIFKFIKLDKKSLKSALIIFFWFIFIGTIILSPTYFSFLYEGAGTTTRVGTLSRDSVISENPLHLGAISTFSSPYISVQKFYNANLWVGTDISMTSIYAGIITFLALFAIINNKNDKWRWWLVFLCLLALSFALSQTFPFRGWLYDLVYPTRFFRHSSIFRAYYLFTITILALFGTRDLLDVINRESLHKWKNFKISSLIIASSAILVFISLINSLSTLGGKINLAYFHLFVFWIGICLIPFVANKFFFYRQTVVVPVFLIGLVLFDVFCIYRLSSSFISTDDMGSVKRWEKLDQQHSSNLDMTSLGLYRAESSCYEESLPCKNLNNDQMIKKTPVFNSYATQVNNYQVEMMKYPALLKMSTGKERIWFSPQEVHLPPTMENFSSFVERSNILGKAPLIIHSPIEMLNANVKVTNSDKTTNAQIIKENNLENVPAMEKIEVNLFKYTSTELVFDVVAPSDGWLLVTDRWARSWKAEVNNKSAPVFGGNFIFRAIQVSQGNNIVRFSYQPFGFPYLLILSWGTLFIVIILTVLFRKNNKLND